MHANDTPVTAIPIQLMTSNGADVNEMMESSATAMRRNMEYDDDPLYCF